MYKVKIEDIKIFGYHGVYANEKKNGQYFYLDIEYLSSVDISKIKHNINEVIDYIDVIKYIKEGFNLSRYNLIEKTANNLMEKLINKYGFKYIKLRIKKIISTSTKENKFVVVELEKKNE